MSTWAGGTPGFHARSQATTVAALSVPVLVLVPRAESKAAYIPLLCYSCRLTFKELVRFWGAGGWVWGRLGVPRLTAPLLQGPLATLPSYVRAEGQRRIHRYRGWGSPPHLLSPPGRVHPQCPSLAELRWSRTRRTRSPARAEGVGDSGGHTPIPLWHVPPLRGTPEVGEDS